jgi:hypothetical protein
LWSWIGFVLLVQEREWLATGIFWRQMRLWCRRLNIVFAGPPHLLRRRREVLLISSAVLLEGSLIHPLVGFMDSSELLQIHVFLRLSLVYLRDLRPLVLCHRFLKATVLSRRGQLRRVVSKAFAFHKS